MPPDNPRIEIDEKFLVEWIDFGWSELISYLTKWARFCELYPEQEEPSDG